MWPSNQLLIALLALASSSLPLVAAPLYSLTDLGTLGGNNSFGTAINNLNQVVGYSDATNNTTEFGFTWSSGVMTSVGTLGGARSRAHAVNDLGEVTGFADLPGSAIHHAFRYSSGVMTDVKPSNPTSTEGYAINDAGQVSGRLYRSTNNNDFRNAFFFDGSNLIDLGRLGGNNASLEGINNAGICVGASDDESITGLQTSACSFNGTLPLTDRGRAAPAPAGNSFQDINNSGKIVGYYDDASTNFSAHAMLLDGSTLTDLGTLGGLTSYGSAINDVGLIVGYSRDIFGIEHGFIFEDGHMYDLNAITPDRDVWTIISASGVNDRGFMVATGVNGEGQSHALLLSPVPDPSNAIALFCAILLGSRRQASK